MTRFPRMPALLLLVGLIAPCCTPCFAAELWSDQDTGRALSLNTAFKFSALGSRTPDERLLFPDTWTATGLFRGRLMLEGGHSEKTRSELAYEHRARWDSSPGGGFAASGGFLPSFAEAPYRIEQLDWQIDAGSDYLYRHEIDRALVAVSPDWGDVVIGRQAIGLGRGVLFGAVDVFAPFSPIEVDREWRRGVDALRVDYRLSPTSSAELIGVAGRDWDHSALLGRVRGYVGNVDGELILGKRARDLMLAGAMSAIVGDAAVHAELALFETPKDHPDGGLFGNDHLIPKAVLGASYTFDVGNGLTVWGEYHYSGFGIENIEEAARFLLREDFVERYLRGDTQTLGRHALGMQMTYPFNQAWSGNLIMLVSPRDGSGLISPTVNWDFSNTGSLRIIGFVPWGPEPDGIRLRSEYGATPITLYAQLALYF